MSRAFNTRKPILILLVVLITCGWEFVLADDSMYPEFIKQVSEEIAASKPSYPQLNAFSFDKHVDIKNLKIEYSYRTYDSELAGGWTSAVPNPYADGVWFYIDLHDKDSMAQIHTQPVTGPPIRFENKSLSGVIRSILKRHGAISDYN